MADFVAVIRRAVDGLATNTPEMRAKVYDKARAAVRRQLENMKPRPPEDMLARQMEKLEAAIVDVEGEHTEALAPENEAAPENEGVPETEPSATAAAVEGAVVEDPPVEEPVAEEQPAQEVEQDTREEPSLPEAEPAVEDHAAEPIPANVPADAPTQDLPEERYQEPEYREQEPSASDEAEAYVEPQPEPVVTAADEEQPLHEVQPEVRPETVLGPDDDGEKPGGVEMPSDDVPDMPPAASEPVELPHVEHTAEAVWNDVPELVPERQEGQQAPQWPEGSVDDDRHHRLDQAHVVAGTPVAAGAHFEDETHAGGVRMPSVSDSSDVGHEADNLDPKAGEPGLTDDKQTESDPWSDLEELIGFNKDGSELPASRPAEGGGLHSDADVDDLMAAPARPYRVKPVRKRNYAGLVLAVVGLALIGGAAYAVLLNRGSLNDMVDGLFASSLSDSSTPGEQASAPATPTPDTAATPDAPEQTASKEPSTPDQAPADGSASESKFTQRLLPDGSEIDEGPGGVSGLARNAVGQSVAQLNAPPVTPAAANSSAEAGAAQPAPAAGPEDAPVLAGEKIFLYEERIGQTAPTAINGSVSWSLQREQGANGRQEPVIQGRLTVPARGLSALMTIKRNGDPSLPASHLIEIVFAVPPDFEGGGIENVLRIAMKASEQDRGNALIAVPAKITDDFYMVALNDFADARKTNLELLRSRNWIDVPIAYRNGRRALLALQKGAEGERVFNEALREWDALGTASAVQ